MSEKTKPIAELTKTEKKALILEALAREGYNPAQAAQLLGVSKQLTYRIDKQMRQGLLTPLVRKARRSIGMLVEGHPVGDMTEVKGSDVLTASKMVVDRYEPIVQRIEQKSLSLKISISDEERERYHKLLGFKPAALIENNEEKK
jgi:hypothetical protein